MLNEVKPNLDLLMSIRLGLAEQYGIPLDVPFRDYKAWYRWTGMEVPAQTMQADFVNQMYSKEGKPCRFEDIFEFERLSKAWDFIDGELKEYEVGEARISEKGLLIEPQSTNQWTGSVYDRFPSGNDAVNSYDVKIEKVFGGPIPNESAVKVTKSGNNARYAISPGGMGGFHRSAFYRADALGAVGILNLRDRAVPLSTEWERYSKVGSNNQLHLFDFRVSGNTLEEAYVVGLQLEEHLVTSHILTDTVPVTRLPETLSHPTSLEFVSFDKDEDILHEDGVFSGFGYIRKIEVKV